MHSDKPGVKRDAEKDVKQSAPVLTICPCQENREKNPCAPDEITEALLRNSREFFVKVHLSTAVISTTSPTRIYIFQSMFHLLLNFIQETCWQAVVHSPVLCHPSCASRSVLSLGPWSREASVACQGGKNPTNKTWRESLLNGWCIHPNYWVVDEFIRLSSKNIGNNGSPKFRPHIYQIIKLKKNGKIFPA